MAIIVIGDVILDEYWHGTSDRISPEAPVPVTKCQKIVINLGGAANVAQNIAALKEDVFLIGICGDDLSAESIKSELKDKNISFSLDIEYEKPTIKKLRILANNHYLGRVDFEEKFSNDISSHFEKTLKEFKTKNQKINYIVLSDYNKGTLNNPQKLINIAIEHGLKVLVDPKQSFEKYKNAWLIKPNKAEFEKFVGHYDSHDQLIEKAKQSISDLNLSYMLITLGSEGAIIVSSQSSTHIPAEVIEVFDVTGAGDTYIATLAALLNKGVDIGKSMKYANLASSIAVRKKGTYTVKLDELPKI